jgi:hypothetical protein
MKTLILLFNFLFAFLLVHAGDLPAISELDSGLLPVYESLLAEGDSAELIGKNLELSLDLKLSSDKYLLFSDTQVVVDDKTRYYLIKWQFKPDVVREILGKSDIDCKVSGRIIEVKKGATTPGMPYVVVELVGVESCQAKEF